MCRGIKDKVIQGGEEIFKKTKVIICEVSFYELYKGQVLFDEISRNFLDIGFKYRVSISVLFHPKTGMPLQGDACFIKG